MLITDRILFEGLSLCHSFYSSLLVTVVIVLSRPFLCSINKWGPLIVVPFPHYTMAFCFCPSAFATPSPSPSPFIPPTPTPPSLSFSQAVSSPLPPLTPTPLHQVPPSRQGSIGPVQRPRGGLGTLSCLYCHRWSDKGLVTFSFPGRISSLPGPRLVIAPIAIWRI